MGFFDRFKKKAEQPQAEPQAVPVVEEPAVQEPEPIQIPKYKFFGASVRIDSWYLNYAYKNVPLLKLDSSKYYEGEGNIDSEGHIYKDGEVIGSIEDKQKIHMAADFISRHEAVKVYFDSPETVYLAFYKETYKAVSSLPSMVCKLTKTSAMDSYFECRRYENLEYTQDGDRFVLEYNDESETYVVKDTADGEVGELTKSDSKKLYAKELDGCDLFAFATECDYDDHDRTICKVEVFIK